MATPESGHEMACNMPVGQVPSNLGGFTIVYKTPLMYSLANSSHQLLTDHDKGQRASSGDLGLVESEDRSYTLINSRFAVSTN